MDILFSVGPIFLTIPSYLTFTVDSQNVTISKTLTDESEVLQAKEAGYAINPTEIEGQWAMETQVPKYYMNFRYVERLTIYFSTLTNCIGTINQNVFNSKVCTLYFVATLAWNTNNCCFVSPFGSTLSSSNSFQVSYSPFSRAFWFTHYTKQKNDPLDSKMATHRKTVEVLLCTR